MVISNENEMRDKMNRKEYTEHYRAIRTEMNASKYTFEWDLTADDVHFVEAQFFVRDNLKEAYPITATSPAWFIEMHHYKIDGRSWDRTIFGCINAIARIYNR